MDDISRYPTVLVTLPEELIEGDLVLRRWRMGDIDAIYSAANNSLSELGLWLPWAESGYSWDDAQGYLGLCERNWRRGWGRDDDGDLDYAITTISSAPTATSTSQAELEVHGSCGLWRVPGTTGVEVGYWLRTDMTGRGLMTRAVRMVAEAAFRAGAEFVLLRHKVGNKRSEAVAKRLGFRMVRAIARAEEEDGQEKLLWRLEKGE